MNDTDSTLFINGWYIRTTICWFIQLLGVFYTEIKLDDVSHNVDDIDVLSKISFLYDDAMVSEQ